MSPSFDSYETWKNVYLVCSILAGVLAILAAISGLVAFWASSKAEIAKQAPRTLKEDRHAKIATLPNAEKQDIAKRLSVLIISIGGQESESYASQIASALGEKANISRFDINSMANAPTGLAILPNGHDPKDLQNLLTSVGIHADVASEPLPIPMSVWTQFSDFIALRVGLKPSH